MLVQLPRRGKTGWGAVAVSGMGLAHRDLDRGLGQCRTEGHAYIGVVLIITVSIANQSHSSYLLMFLWFWG